jgi:hypothetical protein
MYSNGRLVLVAASRLQQVTAWWLVLGRRSGATWSDVAGCGASMLATGRQCDTKEGYACLDAPHGL